MTNGSVLHILVAAFVAAAMPTTVTAQATSACSVRDPDLQGTYEGDCVAGMASGKGRATGKDQYEGGFRGGDATGYAVFTRADHRDCCCGRARRTRGANQWAISELIALTLRF